MTRTSLTPELRRLIAERFKALGEPARLAILDVLRRREMTRAIRMLSMKGPIR